MFKKRKIELLRRQNESLIGRIKMLTERNSELVRENEMYRDRLMENDKAVEHLKENYENMQETYALSIEEMAEARLRYEEAVKKLRDMKNRYAAEASAAIQDIKRVS